MPVFTKPDPCCEGFYHLSPYLFCGNDPVNNVDPTGKVFDTIWDIGNVLYDVGAATYNHITGNHDKARENWVDAGLDAGAMLLPFVPAGASKVGKVVKEAVGKADKVADAVSDGKKVSKGLKNAERIAEGREFGVSQVRKARDSGQSVAEEVTLVPLNGKGNVKGNRTRVDILKNNNETYGIIENKLTNHTPLTKGQKSAKDHVDNGNIFNDNSLFEVRSNVKDLNLRPGQIINVKVMIYIISIKNNQLF